MSTPILDKDGFPPCTMTVEQFCTHLANTFGHADWRVVAFKVRCYNGTSTLTTARAPETMNSRQASRPQKAAVVRTLKP